MKKENDVFSDLEKDIDGDWKNIQTQIRNKQDREMRLQEPKRFYFSSFQEFYRILVDIAYGTKSELEYTIQKLIGRMFYDNNFDGIPNSVIRIWEAIFNPIDFECRNNVSCNNCNKKYDVIYKKENTRIYYTVREFSMNRYEEMTRKIIRVYCPNCGIHLLNIFDGNLVSVSLSPEDTIDSYDEYRRERRYDIK